MTAGRRYAHGPQILADGRARFRLWAPGVQTLDLVIEGAASLPMAPVGEGWFEIETEARPGTLYRFRLPDGLLVPDPASRFQPLDVHGPSELIDPQAFAWTDPLWRGRRWAEAVVYELHLGAFTPEGGFRAAIDRLDHLAELGVTAIEIMPVADFPGARNWGYDGVMPYAPDASYGRPDDFKALVDAAHDRGLMVLLDVVYNHFGPDGNYLPAYAPAVFTDRHQTPWGAAINYDGEHSGPVREFVIENAVYWLDEFHLDGLRLDAVHAIVDDSEPPLLRDLAERVRGADRGRPIHLLLENEDNEARWLTRGPDRSPSLYTAQWNDDVHHVLHVAATGEDMGYYADYLDDTDKLGRALAEGFAFQGEMMDYRQSARGEPSAQLTPQAFVAFIQNHDQIGNRAFGERLTALAAPEALRALSAIYLLLPQVPMLFMGEEWGCAQPFPFFCDFTGELGDAVRQGRREEFKRFPQFQNPAVRERIPDPQAESTFQSAKLDWTALRQPAHAACLEHYRRLLDMRRRKIIPLIDRIERGGRYAILGPSAVSVQWDVGRAGVLSLLANLHDEPVRVGALAAQTIWSEGEAQADGRLGPWSVHWAIQEPS